ncbi:hypothetical protein [Sinorhizobium sp. 8-89]|nr:hypothetical protein [Sinorhizobium sp. 8-89]
MKWTLEPPTGSEDQAMDTMQDWNAYRHALIGRVGDFAKLSPDVLSEPD